MSAFALLVQHLFESAGERGGDLHGLAQVALPLGGLLGQDVAVHRLVANHLAGPRDLETLCGTLVRLLLRHGCLLFSRWVLPASGSQSTHRLLRQACSPPESELFFEPPL